MMEKPLIKQLQVEINLLDDIIWNLEHKENFVFHEELTDIGYVKQLYEIKKKLLEELQNGD